jgi:hypothetical protein
MKHQAELLFMGNGEQSEAECFRIMMKLNDSFRLLSALQQNRSFDDIEELQDEIRMNAEYIYTSLTGRKFNRRGDLL